MAARARRPVLLRTLLTVAAGLAAVGAPAAVGQQSEPVFRGGTNFVLVDAYPHRDGKVVAGLTADDFQIFEDGKRQTIDRLEFVNVNAAAGTERVDPNNLNDMRAQAADPHNRVFVTFLDTLHTTVGESHAARAPLLTVLDRLVGPTDLFGVMTQDMRPQDLTLGRRSLTIADQLARYWTWGERQRGAYVRANPGERALTECFHLKVQPDGSAAPWLVDDDGRQRPLDEVLIDRRREDEVLTALEKLVDYLGEMREARTALLVVTDGWLLPAADRGLLNQALDPGAHLGQRSPTVPRPGEVPLSGGGAEAAKGMTSTEDDPSLASCLEEATRILEIDEPARFRSLMAEAVRRDVSLYPIAMSQLAVMDADPTALTDLTHLSSRTGNLRTLADNTGGLAIVNTNNIDAGIRRMIDELSAYYLIGYYSTNNQMDGRLRRIEVRMTRPGVTVYARSGYRAPNTAAVAKADAEASAAAALAPVTDALGVLGRLRDTTDVFVRGVRDGGQLLVAVELASHVAAEPSWTAGASVQVQITDAAGRQLPAVTSTIARGARGALAAVPVDGSQGPWRVAVRAETAGGRVSDSGDVSNSRSVLLGDPLIYRATSSLRSPLWPAADLQFRRNERLHAEWPAAQALDQRVARLLDRRGQPLPVAVAVTERPGTPAPIVAIDLAIAPLADGDYVIELSAGRGTVTEHGLFGFRVIR